MSPAATRSASESPTDRIPDRGGNASDEYLEAVQAALDEWNSKEDEMAWRDL